MNRPGVVHCIRGYLSPTETFVGNQIHGMCRYEPVVVCRHRSAGRSFDIENMYVIGEHEYGIDRFLGHAAYRSLRILLSSSVRRAAEWVRSHDPAILHFHYGVDAAFFLPLKRLLDVPSVVSLYGYDVSSFPGKGAGIGRLYLQRIFPEVDYLLVMSEDMKKDVIALGAPPEKVLVHYHGIKSERFRCDDRVYAPKGKVNVLCAGTLEPKKGQHHLFAALRDLEIQYPGLDFRVTLLGDGPLESTLRKLVRRFHWEQRVDFVGYVPHRDRRLVEYYRNADIFVHFSTTMPDGDKEGIPGTIVEAMASGLPVISTFHAGIPEAITNGTDGILVRENDIQGLTQSLIALFENADLRRRLGQAAAHRALTQHNLSTKMQDLERIYDLAIDGVSAAKATAL